MPPRIKTPPVAIPPLDLDYRPFDAQVLAAIITETGRRFEARRKSYRRAIQSLNAAAIGFKFSMEAKERPARFEAIELVRRIRRRVTDLLEVLPLEDDDGVEDFGRGPHMHLGVMSLLGLSFDAVLLEARQRHKESLPRGVTMEELAGVWDSGEALLIMHQELTLLVEACDRKIAQLGSQQQQSSIDPARDFLWAACRVYQKLFGVEGLPFSRNPNTGTAGGPLIRFLAACWARVSDTPKTPEALASIVDLLRNAGSAR